MHYFLDVHRETSSEPSFRACCNAIITKDVEFLHFWKFDIFENFFTTISIPYVKNTSEKNFSCLKLEILVSMVSVRVYSRPKTQQFASNVKEIFFEVIGISQGIHNLVLIYKLVSSNRIFSSRLDRYSPNAHERSYWHRRIHL